MKSLGKHNLVKNLYRDMQFMIRSKYATQIL